MTVTNIVLIECGRYDGLVLRAVDALLGPKRLIAGTKDIKTVPTPLTTTDLPIQVSDYAVLYEIRELHDRDSHGHVRAYPIANEHGVKPYDIVRRKSQ